METRTILDTIEPEVGERPVDRRTAIARGASVSSTVAAGLALGSVPAGLAALARDAYGQARLPGAVIGVLNFALVLEYLEAEFYTRGLAATGLIPSADRVIFQTIEAHEIAHVEFLVTTLGRSARPKPNFDFTANGTFANPFGNYETFKALAQAFEDTGVRAYKGQAPALKPYDVYLTAALTIHSVEARHAAEVRRLRGNFDDLEPHQGWITRNNTDIAAAQAVYAGEQNTVHAGVNAAAVAPDIELDEVTESFDEPLSMAEVLAIVMPFLD